MTAGCGDIVYAGRIARWTANRRVVKDHTFANPRAASGRFVRVRAARLPTGTAALSSGNRLLGPGRLDLGPRGQSVDDQRGPLPADRAGDRPGN